METAGGLAKVAAVARELRLEAVQIFSGNPRAFKSNPPDPVQAEQLATALEAAGRPLILHAPYVINPASSEEDNWDRSRLVLEDQIFRAGLLRAGTVVFHSGSHRGAGEPVGLDRMAQAIRRCLEKAPAGVGLAVENTAGGGASLGGRLSLLARLRDVVADSRLTVCLDTAHAFGAGYDIGTAAGAEAWLDRAVELFGRDGIRVIHFNDSLAKVGSLRDRHSHIGQGLIGREGLAAVLAYPALAGIPAILETPRESMADNKRNLKTARRLRTEGLKRL